MIQVLHCPYCQGTDMVRHGKSPEGKQDYCCRECREGHGRTFLLETIAMPGNTLQERAQHFSSIA